MEQLFVLFAAVAAAFIAGVYCGDKFHTAIEAKLDAVKQAALAREKDYIDRLRALEEAAKGKGP